MELLAAMASVAGVLGVGVGLVQLRVAVLARRDAGRAPPENEPARGGLSVAVPEGLLPPEVLGRDDLLAELRQGRRWRGGVWVLAGMGGVGKSTVALCVAAEVRARGRQVWWVNASDRDSLHGGMLEILRRLGAPEAVARDVREGAATAPDRVWEVLSGHRALLVLDNADDPGVLAAARSAAPSDGTGWVRVGERLMILVTTRHTDPATWGSWARTRTLAPLDDASAAAVLRRAAPALDDPGGAEALALARRLGGLPLALRLAGAYLATPLARWRTFADYRHALDGDPSPDAVIDLDLPARDPRGTVLRTWDLSLDALTRQGLTQARDLLFLLSCFAPEAPIPESAVAPASRDRLAALRGLATVALIDITPDRHIRMHPVVADTGRARLLTAYRDRLPGIGADAVALVQAAAADLRSDRPADWPAWRSVIPHLRAMLVWLAPHLDEDALTDLVDLGRAASLSLGLGGTRDAGEEELARSNLAAAARLGDEHPAALVARYRLAAALYNGERFAEAEELLRSLLDDRCGLRGPTHPDTLITRDKLADAIMMQGRYAEAERMYRRITTDQHQVLGPDHPRVLATAIDLAYSLGMQGRHDEAADMCRRVLDDSRRVLGADHLTTVSAGAELARWTFEQGHHDAERLCRESLEVHRRLLGVEHHWTLDIGAVLARAIAAQGRHDEAKAMLDELVETMTRVLGETHSLTTRTRHELTALNQTRREAPE